MKMTFLLSALFLGLFSSTAMASSCTWSHGFLAKFHYNASYSSSIKKVMVHAGVLRTCNYQNCGDGSWVDVKDIVLTPTRNAELAGFANFQSGGSIGGYGSSQASGLMIQYWIEYNDGRIVISPTYQYGATQQFQSQYQYVPESVFENKKNELENTDLESIIKTSVEDIVFNNHC